MAADILDAGRAIVDLQPLTDRMVAGDCDQFRRGAADSSFVADDVDTLAGLGAAGGGAHAEGEWVELDSLTRQARRMAIFMTRLSRKRRPSN